MIVNLKSQTDLSGFYVVYEGSTNLEKKGWYGISHLMEHLMCKNFDHLQEDFDRDGIEWNAYTSSNEIVFYLTGLEDKVNKWKGEFMDLLGGFNVKKAEFENERNIVLEEYMDSFNEQTQCHVLNLSRKLFGDFDPIGLKEDLENLKFMDCLNFFELQYAKPTKIINVSKKDYKNPTLDFADRTIIKPISYGNHNVPLELNNDWKDKTSIAILSPVINEDFAYIHFINAMLSLGLKSPLYQEIREKTVEGVIKNPKKFLTKDRFNLVKDYYTVRMQKDEILRYKNVNQWINPEGWSVYDILDKITLKKVLEVYDKYYQFDSFYISNDKKEFKK